MLTKKHAMDDDFDSPRNVVTENNVDYLSYKFDVLDLAASWRVLTKQKLTIINGLRLENASWRTWAKQKNNLKTINPDTLNWLKDSDVTWLYGPLHSVIKNMDEEDRYNKPKTATTEETYGLMTSSHKKPNESPVQAGAESPSYLNEVPSAQVEGTSSNNNSSVSKPCVSSIHQPQKPLKSALKKVTVSDLLKRSASELQLNKPNNSSGDSISKANQQLGEFSPAVIASHRQPKLRFNQYVEQCVALPHEENRKTSLRLSKAISDTATSDENHDPDENSDQDNVIIIRRSSDIKSIKKIEPALLKTSSRSEFDSSSEDESINITHHSRRRSSFFQPNRHIAADDWEAESAESDALEQHIIRVSKGKESLQHRDPTTNQLPATSTSNDYEESDGGQEAKSDYEYHFDDDDWDTHSEHVEDDPFTFTSHLEYSPVAPSEPVGCQISKAPVNNEPVLPAVRPKIQRSSSDIRTSKDVQKQCATSSSSSLFDSITHWFSSHLSSSSSFSSPYNNTK